jgi:DNA-binding beta-propeller fold protein YncE
MGVALGAAMMLIGAACTDQPAGQVVVPLAGTVSTLAGSPGEAGSADGAGPAARFSNPAGVALDVSGNLYVADFANNTIRKVASDGTVSTLAGSPGEAGSADGAGPAARFDGPIGVAADVSGNLYVADFASNTIRKVTPDGTVSTLAGSPGEAGSADGQGSVARFNAPNAVAVDLSGNVYVADSFNNTIRKVTPDGTVSTLAGAPGEAGSADGPGPDARFNLPGGIAVDGTGNVYVVADFANSTVRRITPGGVVSTLAGAAGEAGSVDGTGTAARFAGPPGVAADAQGNVYVADAANNTIRKVTPDGTVSTLAGSPGVAGSADGPGPDARFDNPYGLAVNGAGTVLYVADTLNHTVRKII